MRANVPANVPNFLQSALNVRFASVKNLYKAVLNYHLGTCTLVQHNKAYTLRPLSYSRADFASLHCTHTLKLPPAPVAASARLPVEKLFLKASQCKRAIHQDCKTSTVMVNTAVVPYTVLQMALTCNI